MEDLEEVVNKEKDIDRIRTIFSEEYMQTLKPDYEYRESQATAAELVLNTIYEKGNMILEGPCGFGKTFAYLIPALTYLYTHPGQRVLIATSGKQLQTQLASKDVPTVLSMMHKMTSDRLKFCTVKGRNNFICQTKIGDFIATKNGHLGLEHKAIYDWYMETETGDVADVDFEITKETIREITCVENHECTGKKCGNYSSCFYQRQLVAAQNSDIIIVNYHLLFANVNANGNLLPRHDILIMDEAHEAVDIFRDFNSEIFSFKSFTKLLENLEKEIDEYENKAKTNSELKAIKALIPITINAAIAFFEDLYNKVFKDINYSSIMLNDFRYEIPLSQVNRTDMRKDLGILRDVIFMSLDIFASGYRDDALMELCCTLDVYYEKIGSLIKLLDFKALVQDRNGASWVESDDGGRTYGGDHYKPSINRKPVFVGEEFGRLFFNSEDVASILTSATMSTNGNFDFLKDQLGVDTMEDFIGESPFNLREQEHWYCPTDAANGKDKDFDDSVVRHIREIVQASHGGALCLFTTVKNMRACFEELAPEFEHLGIKCLMQGTKSANKVVDEFKKDLNSVLFATKTFFTGIDIPGDSLRVLIIDKLPFPNFMDPVVKKYEQTRGFVGYSLPKMLITLKQAVGRGVRSKNDKCVVAILDNRLISSTYSKTIRKTFPWNRGSQDINSINSFLT